MLNEQYRTVMKSVLRFKYAGGIWNQSRISDDTERRSRKNELLEKTKCYGLLILPSRPSHVTSQPKWNITSKSFLQSTNEHSLPPHRWHKSPTPGANAWHRLARGELRSRKWMLNVKADLQTRRYQLNHDITSWGSPPRNVLSEHF